MDDIINNLPTQYNYDFFSYNSEEFLEVSIKQGDEKYTVDSVLVVAVECKTKSLFDINVAPLTTSRDLTRNRNDNIFLAMGRDNIYFLDSESGKPAVFTYYIYQPKELYFQIKAYMGSVKFHTYTNVTLNGDFYDFYIDQSEAEKEKNGYHHVSDFEVDAYNEDVYNGRVAKDFGERNYLIIEAKPQTRSLIFITLNYNEQKETKQLPLGKEVEITLNDYREYTSYFDFLSDTEEVFLSVTSLDPNNGINAYVKTNIIPHGQESIVQYCYSFPNENNYDLKGKTNSITSSLTLRIKNAPKEVREGKAFVRVFIYLKSTGYSYDQKVSLTVSPNIDNYKRIKPMQKRYYYNLVNQEKEKAVFTLTKDYLEDDLFVVEISSCHGNFDYEVTKDIQKKKKKLEKINSKIYESNGKKIIIIQNINEDREYYLSVWTDTDYNGNPFNLLKQKTDANSTEFLFFYYSTESQYYTHTVTHDMFLYDELGKGKIKIQLPELKQRDAYGTEMLFESVTYSLAITDDFKDYQYMESTCFLSKKYEELIERKSKLTGVNYVYNKEDHSFVISGIVRNKKYYVNILIRNLDTNEVLTYKPTIILLDSSHNIKLGIIMVLFIIALLLSFMACEYYKKYKINRMKLNYEINEGGPLPKSLSEIKKAKKMKGEITIEKKKYTSLNEDSNSLNDS